MNALISNTSPRVNSTGIHFTVFLSSMKESGSSRTILRPERTVLPAGKIGVEIFSASVFTPAAIPSGAERRASDFEADRENIFEECD